MMRLKSGKGLLTHGFAGGLQLTTRKYLRKSSEFGKGKSRYEHLHTVADSLKRVYSLVKAAKEMVLSTTKENTRLDNSNRLGVETD